MKYHEVHKTDSKNLALEHALELNREGKFTKIRIKGKFYIVEVMS